MNRFSHGNKHRPLRREAAVALVLMLGVSSLLGVRTLAAHTSSTDSNATAGTQAERVAVGDEAIDFSLESIDGESYRLSELRGQKNAILIFFRGAW